MKSTKMFISALVLTSLVGGAVASAAEVGVYTSNGVVGFVENDDPTNPVDPENPENEVEPIDPTNPGGDPNPGTGGSLSIDFVSSLVFGENKISSNDETYFANAQELKDGTFRGNYAQVTDKRGTNVGWSLKVKQDGQFRNEDTLNEELAGAEITFSNPALSSNTQGVTAPTATGFALDPMGEEALVMSAAEGAGAGTWLNMFGTVEEMEGVQKNKAVALSVPGSIAKDAVSYKTRLMWVLSDAPGNE
ncbi:WxL domain-containing protein [Vagococcus sp. BWB3-3]|uniref:WxL domain-containing protein n=1 Tax=Vagococcus allomyrinae TaxID=2794353 RepID=A0A940P223_9ENTE|nr:WxL domain-containing protein [Vagococcus allomyrinae]MBP1040024.1 WxL domain-containing protein [Vagococcus allomyrinae]